MFDQQFAGNAQSIIQAVDHRCPRTRLRSHPFNYCTGFGALLFRQPPAQCTISQRGTGTVLCGLQSALRWTGLGRLGVPDRGLNQQVLEKD